MPSRSNRNNNIGNIMAGGFSEWIDAASSRDPEGYAVFRHEPMGVAATARLLAGSAYDKLSIRQAIEKWAPLKAGNPVESYISFVCLEVGIPSNRKIKDLSPFEFINMIRAMATFEGWY